MKKEDLKYGNVVETKEGHRYFVPAIIKGVLMGLTEENNLLTEYIKDDLSNEYSKLDIMKVYEDYTCSKLLWERPQDLLTQEEKDYLKAVIMPFKDKVESIMKSVNCEKKEYIEIFFQKDDDGLQLPYIKNMTLKFKGLETRKEYTLKELGLEE